jgi:hypothetical protein
MKMSRTVGLTAAVFLVWLLSSLVTSGDSSVSPSLGEKALQDLTPLERTILADKLVSPGEYRLAKQDTVDCLRTAGFTVSDIVQTEDGTLGYSASYSPPEMATAGPDAPRPDSSRMDAKNAACEQRSAGVGAVFVLQHATSLTTRPLPGLSEALARYTG